MCSLDCRQNWDEIRTSVVAQHTADTEQAAHSRRRLRRYLLQIQQHVSRTRSLSITSKTTDSSTVTKYHEEIISDIALISEDIGSSSVSSQ